MKKIIRIVKKRLMNDSPPSNEPAPNEANGLAEYAMNERVTTKDRLAHTVSARRNALPTVAGFATIAKEVQRRAGFHLLRQAPSEVSRCQC